MARKPIGSAIDSLKQQLCLEYDKQFSLVLGFFQRESSDAVGLKVFNQNDKFIFNCWKLDQISSLGISDSFHTIHF